MGYGYHKKKVKIIYKHYIYIYISVFNFTFLLKKRIIIKHNVSRLSGRSSVATNLWTYILCLLVCQNGWTGRLGLMKLSLFRNLKFSNPNIFAYITSIDYLIKQNSKFDCKDIRIRKSEFKIVFCRSLLLSNMQICYPSENIRQKRTKNYHFKNPKTVVLPYIFFYGNKFSCLMKANF